MRKVYRILAVLNIIILLCSCTAEPKSDLIEFCRRVNRQSKVELDSSAYYLDTENEYCYFLSVGASECILALSTDTDNCVNELRLTTLNEGSDVDAASVFDYYLTLCSVLTTIGKAELNELFANNGITEASIAFTDNSYEIEGEKYTCFVYTQQQMISLYCAVT